MDTKSREVALKIAQYRAHASLYRQMAVFDPERSWQVLGQAERWEHLAETEILKHFVECNVTSSNDLRKPSYLQTRMIREGRRLLPPECLCEQLGNFRRAEAE